MLISERLCWSLLLSSCLWLSLASVVTAQTTPDDTLGSESSTVTVEDDLTSLIEGGAVRGNNLFHSFLEFNIEEGNAAYFANPDGIANILTRVTGNNVSKIFGTLGVNGTANLFLLNPNGIIFGENAALDINGSFLATTADSYVFGSDFAYGVSNPDSPPLLTINIPIGLQFGSKSADIRVEGKGSNLDANPFDGSIVRNFRTPGLQTPANHTLALVGGQLDLEGGNLTSEAGRIELGSVAETGLVSILPTDNGFTFGYEDIDRFGDVNLVKAASVDVSGSGSGDLRIQGRNLSLTDGSAIIANTLGTDNGNDLEISTSDSIEVAGVDSSNGRLLVSAILNEVEATAMGNGGNLTLDTKNLLVTNSGKISSSNFGRGNSGNQTITADTLKIANNALVGSATYAEGNGGDVSIAAKEIEIIGTSDNSFPTGLFTNVIFTPPNEFYSGTSGLGNGGNLSINTEQLRVSDLGLISSSVLGEGDGGDLNIATDSLQISNGSQISSGTFEAGDSGNLSVVAKDIEIVGTPDINIPTGLFTNVLSSPGGPIGQTVATGNGGNLSIDTEQLRVSDRGIISSTVLGEGDGGDLNIATDTLQILSGSQIGSGTSASGNAGELSVIADETLEIVGYAILSDSSTNTEIDVSPSSLFSSVGLGGIGDGGSLSIATKNLRLTEGGTIGASTSGIGDAGDITIVASDVEIQDFITSVFGVDSGVTSSVESIGLGDGGNIELDASNLNLSNGGAISVDTKGQGNAGNITINAENININGVSSGEDTGGIQQQQSPATVSASSQGDFDAGSIIINSSNLQISDRGNISVSNLGNGNSGNLNLTTSKLSLDDSATIEAQVNTGNRGNIRLNTDNIFLNERSEITANAGNTATGGNIVINNTENIVLLENSKIVADAIAGDGGSIDIITQGYFVSAHSLVSASSELGLDGNIEIKTIDGDRAIELDRLPDNVTDASEQITQACGSEDNKFAVVGKGGLPENPSQNLRGQAIWKDLRLPVIRSAMTGDRLSNINLSNSTPVEANSWQITRQGKIQLLARNQPNRQPNYYNCQQAPRSY